MERSWDGQKPDVWPRFFRSNCGSGNDSQPIRTMDIPPEALAQIRGCLEGMARQLAYRRRYPCLSGSIASRDPFISPIRRCPSEAVVFRTSNPPLKSHGIMAGLGQRITPGECLLGLKTAIAGSVVSPSTWRKTIADSVKSSLRTLAV